MTLHVKTYLYLRHLTVICLYNLDRIPSEVCAEAEEIVEH
jgi:hypothetical protein